MNKNTDKKYASFSVLISVYHKEKAEYLDSCLDSIYKQTIKPNQIVIVKDGKLTNELEFIIKKYKALFLSKLEIVELKENVGLGNALRIGSNYIKNEWIARMDSDDIATYDRFENQLMVIKKNKNLALVGGQVEEFKNGKITGKRNVPTDYQDICKFLKWRSPFNHPTIMIKKKCLDYVGNYEEFGNLEDYYLWSKVIISGFDVLNLKDVLVYMRVNDSLYSRRGNLRNIKHIISLRKYLRKNKQINIYQELIGDILMISNIIIPNYLRKNIYTKILHKN